MKTSTITLRRSAIAAAALVAATLAQAGEVEVLHYWTSGGEAKAAAALKATLQAKGHSWKDFAVAGGGGDSAMTVLKSRVVSGNSPAAAQIKGPSIQEWGREGVLANLDDVAKANNWDALLPKVVSDVMKVKGSYAAVPVNVHRVNWLWASPEALKKANAKLPTTWDEFFVTAEALKKAGIVPVAHGGQPWQDFTTFESVALGVGGADFYKKAFVELDGATLKSPTMDKVLTTFKRIKSYTDKNAPGRDWNLATAMVIRGEAGMQLMGDWAKGEFVAAGKKPGADFLCAGGPRHRQLVHLQRRLVRDVQDQERRERDGAEGPGHRHHGARVPGGVQPQQGLDPGAAEHGHGQVRRLRQAVEPGLRQHRQDRRPGAVGGARHGRALGGRGCAEGRGVQLLERRQDDQRPGDGPHRRRREDEVRQAPACPRAPPAGARPSPVSAGPPGPAQELTMSLPSSPGGGAWLPRLVVAPSFVLGFLFIYGLIAWNGWFSVSASRLLPNYEYLGFEVYGQLFESDRFRVALTNMLIFGVLFIGGAMVIGLLLAVLLDQKIRAEGALRSIFLYPMALSMIVTGTAWKWILNPGLGLEKLMQDLGWTSFTFGWLVDPNLAIYCIVIAGVWQSAGFVMALFLAGLRGIDESIIKAAQVDGASLPQVYWRILIPSLGPVFFSTLMVLSHLAIKSFDLVMALTAGGPGYATDLPATYMYAMAFTRGQINLGAASATIMLATVAAIVVPYLYSELRVKR